MSYSEYTCPRCGDTFGIAGESTGSDEDFETDRYYSEQVEWHESGQCAPARAPLVEFLFVRIAEGIAALRRHLHREFRA